MSYQYLLFHIFSSADRKLQLLKHKCLYYQLYFYSNSSMFQCSCFLLIGSINPEAWCSWCPDLVLVTPLFAFNYDEQELSQRDPALTLARVIINMTKNINTHHNGLVNVSWLRLPPITPAPLSPPSPSLPPHNVSDFVSICEYCTC